MTSDYEGALMVIVTSIGRRIALSKDIRRIRHGVAVNLGHIVVIVYV